MSSEWHVDDMGGKYTLHPWDEDGDNSHLRHVEIDDWEIAWFKRVEYNYEQMQNRLAEIRREQEKE
jgi:hypothetical protein